MLKKVCIHNPSKIICTENGQIRCSVCKNKSKSMYYLCKSKRHVVCGDCNGSESLKNRNDDGDKECDTSGGKEISYIFRSKSQPQNLASGDHIETVESYKITVSKTEVTKSVSSLKSQTTTNDVETTVNYINNNYNDSQSSVASSNILVSEENSTEAQIRERVTRPVICPVTKCSRMVIITSFYQHFHFDHSKVLRMVLYKTEPQEILITYSTLSTETNSFATFVLTNEKRANHRKIKNNISPGSLPALEKTDQLVFLMAAKLIITLKNYSTQYTSTRNRHTQTGHTQTGHMQTGHTQSRNRHKKLSLTISNSGNLVNVPNKSINLENNDNKDEVLLLWLCSLDSKEKTFTVTVSRTDQKQGYSYTGTAVHIKEQQDPISIYNRTECLSVRKAAVERLVEDNELKILVSLVQ